MRTEKEMMDLIITIAKNDDRIRAVYMNGSRTVSLTFVNLKSSCTF